MNEAREREGKRERDEKEQKERMERRGLVCHSTSHCGMSSHAVLRLTQPLIGPLRPSCCPMRAHNMPMPAGQSRASVLGNRLKVWWFTKTPAAFQNRASAFHRKPPKGATPCPKNPPPTSTTKMKMFCQLCVCVGLEVDYSRVHIMSVFTNMMC